MTYVWKCTRCSLIIEVDRPMNDYNRPPESHVCTGTDGEWERVFEPVSIKTGDGFKL